MRRIGYLAIIGMLFGAARCTNDVTPAGDYGLITGIDYRKCMCCGGTFIDIKGNTYRFDALPANTNFQLDSGTQFPIQVTVSWKLQGAPCAGQKIELLHIARLP